MIKHFLLSCILTSSFLVGAQNVSHEAWNELLQKYVDPYGKVDYASFKEDEKSLDEYLDLLSKNHPRPFWKVDEQKAYWINAYNAFTIKLVLKNYPLKSIMDIKENGKNAWNIPFIEIGGKKYTLDYIEKTMLLGQFNDSRIHFVVNCSAVSCPPLKNKAYTADRLEIELRLQARSFINDNRFNSLSKNHVQISEIFNWYKDDFLKEESSIQIYLNKNTPHLEISKDATITYHTYNWSLNGK